MVIAECVSLRSRRNAATAVRSVEDGRNSAASRAGSAAKPLMNQREEVISELVAAKAKQVHTLKHARSARLLNAVLSVAL